MTDDIDLVTEDELPRLLTYGVRTDPQSHSILPPAASLVRRLVATVAALMDQRDAAREAVTTFLTALHAYEDANTAWSVRGPKCSEARDMELSIAALTTARAADEAKAALLRAIGGTE